MNRKRAFLTLLVLFLLLSTMANQQAQNPAALVGSARILGHIPLWKLHHVLPAGIFAAGVCAVSLGIGAEFWRALLPLCGAQWAPRTALNRLADAGLWCGWVPLAACITALGCVFPWSVGAPGAYGPGESATTFFDIEHYRLVLQIGGGGMILCRVLSHWLNERAALPIVILTAGIALVCGQFWCQAQPITYFCLALLMPWALLLIWHPGRLSPQQFYISIAATAIALYGVAFSHTIGGYVIVPSGTSFHGNHLAISAGLIFTALLLSLVLRPCLQRTAWLRFILGLTLLLSILYTIWHLVALGAVGEQTPELLLHSLGCYIVPLLSVSGLIAMRLYVTSAQKSPEINEI